MMIIARSLLVPRLNAALIIDGVVMCSSFAHLLSCLKFCRREISVDTILPEEGISRNSPHYCASHIENGIQIHRVPGLLCSQMLMVQRAHYPFVL